ncbi:MAG: ABC transporter permease [Candidatus Odinarchaeia archaeon]
MIIHLFTTIWDGMLEAFRLLLTGDPEIWSIVLLSLRVSLTAVFFAALAGIPIGCLIGLNKFPGKTVVINLINTFMGLPPVVVGLVVFLALSSSGPLGFLDLLYTPTAIVIAQFIIATPIVAGICMAAVSSIDKSVIDTAKSLGATKTQVWWLTVKEARIGILGGIAVAFGQSISEVGASIIVGGNIRGFTRVLTTAVVLETRQGAFGVAIALGLVLILLAFIVNSVILTRLQFKSIPKS